MAKYNYKFIGNCNITNLKHQILQLTEQDWQEHQLRQTFFKAHQYTNTLEILWDANSVNNNTIGKVHNNFFKLNIDLFLKDIEGFYKKCYGEGYFVRILITRLKLNSKILPHIDDTKGLKNSKRTHIPIQTNSNCIFNVGGEIKQMSEGEIWEINNTGKIHSVENNSNQDRIHIILDYNLH